MHPLDGITVVTLEQAVSAPFATRQLADLGARVIKVERPGVGDFARAYDTTVNGLSSYFVWVNRGKESLTLDLKHPTCREVVLQLLEHSDVFLQNLAPGATERLGLGDATLRARFPRLITCTITGYGTGGSYRDQKAYDTLVQAETGVMSLTGASDAPARVGIPVADIAAGMYAYSGVLTALYARERTGQGQSVAVSMLDALGEWVSSFGYYTVYGGTQPPRSGAVHPTIAPYGPFAVGDGKTVFLGIQNEREWASFCRGVLHQPELTQDSRFATNSARVQHRTELQAVIEVVFRDLTTEQVVQRLEEAQIANSRLRDVREFMEHPSLLDRDRYLQVDSPVGPLRLLRPAVDLEGAEPAAGAIPALGQHTDAILTALGYTTEQITQLRADAVI